MIHLYSKFSENQILSNLIEAFDEKLFTSVVDKIVVKSYTKVAIVFRNGQELYLNLEEYK